MAELVAATGIPSFFGPGELFGLWLNRRRVEVAKAKLLAEAFGVSSGRRSPPRDWFDNPQDGQKAEQNFLTARLHYLMNRAAAGR